MITQPIGNSNHSYPAEYSIVAQINKTSGIWYLAIDMTDVLFSIPVREEKQTVAIVLNEQKYAFTILNQG